MKLIYANLLLSTTTTLRIVLQHPCGVNSFSPSLSSLTHPNNNIAYQRQHFSTSIPSSKSNNNNNSNEQDFTDHAPCFDSICDSDPPTNPSPINTSPGTATLRLGLDSNPTVWSEFGRIASTQPNLANLGQGFPDWLPPKFAVDALVEGVTDVSRNSPHQYTRTAGHGSLVRELAERYGRHLGRELDCMAEVAVTVGASQALFVSLQTLIQPGDEVILFEPFFDLYVNQIKLAGGIPVYVPLTFQPYSPDNDTNGFLSGGEWILESHELEQKITSNTRAIILNSPHNPTGKIFSMEEMECIAHAVRTVAEPRCVVLSDEVYKYIVHSTPDQPAEEFQTTLSNSDTTQHPIPCRGHIHFASLPSMYDRTITISSAGKTFSATGWQVGWAVGPSHLLQPMHQLLPYVQFCASTVLQEALARALPRADEPYEGHASYYAYLKHMYTRKRDTLGAALTEAGFAIPDWDRTAGGGFFIFCRITPQIRALVPAERIDAPNAAAPGGVARLDWALCQWLAEEKGVLCIPATPFFFGGAGEEWGCGGICAGGVL